jgi:iron(III) transport system ATP-binding protein
MQLELAHIRKTFGAVLALDDITFAATAPEFVCLLGPSGCGKTTLLRLIAGLAMPDGGSMRLDGAELTQIPARRRGFGIVFQGYSLFPNMTVADNVGYGLRIRGARVDAVKARVKALLELVHLAHLAARYPFELSGGQQQRVALARAVAVDPKLLLLDEPLSALDAKVRLELRGELRDLQQRLGILTLMVTHDQEEALSLADRIVCMNAGKVAQIGTPDDLYHRPANRFVADFVGLSNLVALDDVRRFAPALVSAEARPGDVACIRPEDVAVVADGRGARVRQVQFLGNVSRLALDWPGGRLTAEQPGRTPLAPGAEVGVEFRRCVWVRDA